MKKRKFLQTDFIKFILEKYAQSQDLPDDEIETPDDQELKRKRLKKLNELEDEDDIDNGSDDDDEKGDDEIIDELLNEYKRLKRKYESKSNRLHIRRK
jgi:hypothetical protein